MQSFLLVFIGGGLGSIARYAIALGLQKQEWDFPLATFIANVISCIILGFFVGMAIKSNMEAWVKLFFMVGFCGGFSTFSTFSNESFQLIQDGNYLTAGLYILSSFLVCLLCIFTGLKVSQAFIS